MEPPRVSKAELLQRVSSLSARVGIVSGRQDTFQQESMKMFMSTFDRLNALEKLMPEPETLIPYWNKVVEFLDRHVPEVDSCGSISCSCDTQPAGVPFTAHLKAALPPWY